MTWEEYVVHLIRGLLIFGTVIISLGVWKYLSKKPPGMETLYDLMIKNTIIIVNLKLVAGQMVLLKFGVVYPKFLAFVLVYFDFSTLWSLHLQIVVAILIR